MYRDLILGKSVDEGVVLRAGAAYREIWFWKNGAIWKISVFLRFLEEPAPARWTLPFRLLQAGCRRIIELNVSPPVLAVPAFIALGSV